MRFAHKFSVVFPFKNFASADFSASMAPVNAFWQKKKKNIKIKENGTAAALQIENICYCFQYIDIKVNLKKNILIYL